MATHTVNVIASLDPASKSTGGNESADAGKLLEFNSEGQIQGSSNSSSLAAVKGTASGSGYGVHGESSSGTGVVGQSTKGNGVDASSEEKQAVSAINFHATEPVIKAKNANAANTAPLAQFHRNNNQGLTIKNDGGLEWDSATGAATTRTGLGLGTAALQPSTAFDPAGSAAAAQAAAIAASQPLDSDLTAIAALSTTAYGRALLTLADAASGRTSFGLGTASTVNTGTGASDVPTITDADGRYLKILDAFTLVKKPSFTSRNNNTLANDPDLFFPMAANTSYTFTITVYIQASAAGDFKSRVTGPAAPTSVFLSQTGVGTTGMTPSNRVAQAYDSTDLTQTFTSDFLVRLIINGTVNNGVNAGDLVFQWAQNTTSAGSPALVLAGSTVEWSEI